MTVADDILKSLDSTSESSKADLILESINGSPGGIVGEVLGGVETLATVGTGTIAEPVSGLVGLASVPFTDNPGDVVEKTQRALTFEPRTAEGQRNLKKVGQFLEPLADALEFMEQGVGEIGFDLAGPIGGAIASAIPTAMVEGLSLAAPNLFSKISRKKAAMLDKKGGDLTRQADELSKAASPDNLEGVAEKIAKGDIEDVAIMADIDPDFIKAADELNIDVSPLTSFASKNPIFRKIEQSLAALPVTGANLDAQGLAFVTAVSKKADELIGRYGGTLDKAGLSDRFRQESLKTIDNLFVQADDLYNKLDEIVPRETSIDADNTLAFIEKKSKQSKGKITPLMAKIKRDLTPETKTVIGTTGQQVEVPTSKPTYELLSQRRREVGQALSKKTGPFKDAEEGLLKALYSRLRKDQDALARKMGGLDVSKAADGLVIQRKLLEDSLKNVLGSKLKGSLMVESSNRIKSLAKGGKGDIEKFRNFINDIPENFRQEVVVSSLNDIFRGTGIDQQGLNVTQYSKLMDDLNRQPTIKKILYDNLPEGAGKDLDNLHTLSKGISVAQQDKIKTGIVTDLFDNQGGLLRKTLGKSAEFAIGGAVAKTTGSPLAASVVRDFLSSKSSKSEAVSNLLASEQFRTLMIDSVSQGVVKGRAVSKKLEKAEKAFEKSKVYKGWADSLPDNDRAKLLSLGVISYMFDEQTEEAQ